MKRTFAVLGMVLLAALLVFPGTAKSEMYIEGYLGGVAAGDDSFTVGTSHPGWPGTETNSVSGKFDNPFFQGGLKFGAWFDKSGVLSGINFPDWMKYFGVYLDLSYHSLNYRRQNGTTTATDLLIVPLLPISTGTVPNQFRSDGRVFTLAFMFAARYGFLPDSEVPFGRLQPYVAVGPALMISSQRAQLSSNVWNVLIPGPGPSYTITTNTKSSANIALAVEAGMRWMALKNVSIDVSFKYRWAEPSYNFDAFDSFNFTTGSYDFKPTYNLFSGQVGAAYHF